MMFKPNIYLKKQLIRYSFIQKLVNNYGPEETGRIFYRGRNANNIIAWINGGLLGGYAFVPVDDEYNNPNLVKKWIDEKIFSLENRNNNIIEKGMASIGDILKTIEGN